MVLEVATELLGTASRRWYCLADERDPRLALVAGPSLPTPPRHVRRPSTSAEARARASLVLH